MYANNTRLTGSLTCLLLVRHTQENEHQADVEVTLGVSYSMGFLFKMTVQTSGLPRPGLGVVARRSVNIEAGRGLSKRTSVKRVS